MEFKTVACSFTGALILVEIKRGKEGIKKSKCYLEFGSTAAFKKRTIEDTKGLYQRYTKGATKAFNF